MAQWLEVELGGETEEENRGAVGENFEFLQMGVRKRTKEGEKGGHGSCFLVLM